MNTDLFYPSAFSLTHYRLTLEALEPLHLPPFKGSALRGGFGHTFKQLVCFQPQPCGARCELGNACPYGYIFETAPPEGAEVLSKNTYVPRPFIIAPPDDERTRIPAGERLTFGLTLIGRATNYLPYFIAVFRELGRVGLGRPFDSPQGKRRGQYRLLAIDAVSPWDGATAPVYRAEDDMVRTANITVGGEDVAAHAARLSPDRLTLTFLTPTRLKHQGRWVRHGPPFDALVKALLSRVSSLSYFHCGQRFETDFRGLIDRAAGVRIERSETYWEDWARFSGRQKQWVEMGGLVGRVSYEGDLYNYLPLLALGELIHIGKGTVFGNGQYRIENGDSDRERV
jgi:hypothetical protein